MLSDRGPSARNAWRFVFAHAAKFGAAGYAFATVYGLLHSAALAWVTGFNPLLFFDASDFALTGFRHPVGLVLPFAVFFALMLVNMLFAMPFCSQPCNCWPSRCAAEDGCQRAQ